MNATNMLSANKVKLHGMTSTKWTTKDKITQYKGLIKLYTRDRKIIEMDTEVADKKQFNQLKKLQKEIEENRKDLDNAIKGDKQKLRNTLAEHREMQLAFQSSQPQKVIEMVEQVNFNKRKSRDLLQYKKKLKTEELIDLKLRYAELGDVLKFEGMSWQSMFPSERMAHIISGKVEDAILKTEAAIVIRHSYKEMIAVMKKDALYFDAILAAIKNDGLNQGKCMVNAIKLGQLATEYLDDRRQEFEALARVIKQDLADRRRDLETVKRSVENFGRNVKNLLRRDSDINLGKVQLLQSESFTNLKNDMETVEATLKLLKELIFVPNIESIYPCLQEQVRQRDRLKELVEFSEQNRDEMEKRVNHATLAASEMENTMIETTSQYKEQKNAFLTETENQNNKRKELEIVIKSRYNLLAKARISLKHLQLLATLLSSDVKPKFNEHWLHHGLQYIPQEEEIDGTKIVPDLLKRYSKLAQNSKDLLKGVDRENGYKMFEVMMHETTRSMVEEKVISEESLIDTVIHDPKVLSRADIKKQSDDIVQLNQKSDDVVPDSKKKRFS